MNLKNNLKNYFPLKVAISSVFGFFIIYILFGLDGWGDRASNENAIGEVSRWCERVSDGLLREPSNTLGNLGLMQEQNKVAFPNYSGNFEKTLLQDFQKVAE